MLSLYAAVETLIGRSASWRLGRWLYLGSRRELLNDPRVNGEYFLLHAWMAPRANRGADNRAVVLDIGANIGDWTVTFLEESSRIGFSNFTLRAFEPAPAQQLEFRERCREAIARGDVVVDVRAVGETVGKAIFSVTGEATGTSGLKPGGVVADDHAFETDVTTLDEVSRELALSGLDFVKVDTEGNDFNVILGAVALFDREAITILQFEYNWRWLDFGHRLRDVFRFLKNRPYRLGRLTADGVEFYDAWHPELDRYIETNYAIVHEASLADIPSWTATFDESNVVTRLKSRG